MLAVPIVLRSILAPNTVYGTLSKYFRELSRRAQVGRTLHRCFEKCGNKKIGTETFIPTVTRACAHVWIHIYIYINIYMYSCILWSRSRGGPVSLAIPRDSSREKYFHSGFSRVNRVLFLTQPQIRLAKRRVETRQTEIYNSVY